MRRLEQKKAGFVGEYSAVAFLDHPSEAVKSGRNPDPKDDLKALLMAAARPKLLSTHNLADKHDTHVGVALRTIEAIRELPVAQRPKKLCGCEVWRGLDGCPIAISLSSISENTTTSPLLSFGVFDSQISDGKRYDLAIMGRRRANATLLQNHQVDAAEYVNFGMDLTPLVQDDRMDPREYVTTFVQRFAADVTSRIEKVK